MPPLLEAVLVDVDDDHRPLRCDARLNELVEIEGAQPQRLDGQRIPDAQQDKIDKQHESDRPADAEPVQEAEEALHGATADGPKRLLRYAVKSPSNN